MTFRQRVLSWLAANTALAVPIESILIVTIACSVQACATARQHEESPRPGEVSDSPQFLTLNRDYAQLLAVRDDLLSVTVASVLSPDSQPVIVSVARLDLSSSTSTRSFAVSQDYLTKRRVADVVARRQIAEFVDSQIRSTTTLETASKEVEGLDSTESVVTEELRSMTTLESQALIRGAVEVASWLSDGGRTFGYMLIVPIAQPRRIDEGER